MDNREKTSSFYSKKQIKRIHITTGDCDGIGLEVSLKALYELGPLKNIQFVLWRSKNSFPPIPFKVLDKKFKRLRIKEKDFIKTLALQEKKANLIDLTCHPNPTKWVERASKISFKHSEILVTGPLSKTQMQKEGFSEKGHTPLLKKISSVSDVFMCFLGAFFNVVLLTGHVPLKKLRWNKKTLKKCLRLSMNLKATLPASQKRKPIAFLGLNPHAGEEGLLGSEDLLLKKELKSFKEIKGPLVPDTAFLKANQKKFSIYIACYHDQALIPFKMAHERNSFQLSLGLPFIRTSVSHGTAKDIFNKNQADPQSMKKAILGALSLAKQQDSFSL